MQPERVNVGGGTTAIVADWVTFESLIEETFRVMVMLLVAGNIGGV